MTQRPAETEELAELTPEEISELDDRADAVERGEFVDGDEVIRRLRTGSYIEADEGEDSYELTPEQEEALEESIEQIARGEFVTAKVLFDELREIRERAFRDRSSSEAE